MDIGQKRLNIARSAHLFSKAIRRLVYEDEDIDSNGGVAEGTDVLCCGGWFEQLEQFLHSHS